MSRVAGYAEKFCDKHKGYTDAQLEKVRSELLQELEELSDAEEFHSFQYAFIASGFPTNSFLDTGFATNRLNGRHLIFENFSLWEPVVSLLQCSESVSFNSLALKILDLSLIHI